MSTRPLPAYQEMWGLTDQTHEAVLRKLEDNYGGPDLVELDRTYRDLPSEMYEGPEVEQGTYRHALREVDNRTWHDRCVDALVQFHRPTFEDSEFDLMLVEQEYDYTLANTDYSTEEDIDRSMIETGNISVPKSDIDFARLSFRSDHIFVELWEAKSSQEALEKSTQLQDHVEALNIFEEETGVEVRTRTRGLTPEGVKDKVKASGDQYGIPRSYGGSVDTGSTLDASMDSGRVQSFQEHFLGKDLDVEEALEEVSTQEELIS